MRSAGPGDGAPACITLTSLDCRPGNPLSDLAIHRHAAVTGVCVDAAGHCEGKWDFGRTTVCARALTNTHTHTTIRTHWFWLGRSIIGHLKGGMTDCGSMGLAQSDAWRPESETNSSIMPIFQSVLKWVRWCINKVKLEEMMRRHTTLSAIGSKCFAFTGRSHKVSSSLSAFKFPIGKKKMLAQ